MTSYPPSHWVITTHTIFDRTIGFLTTDKARKTTRQSTSLQAPQVARPAHPSPTIVARTRRESRLVLDLLENPTRGRSEKTLFLHLIVTMPLSGLFFFLSPCGRKVPVLYLPSRSSLFSPPERENSLYSRDGDHAGMGQQRGKENETNCFVLMVKKATQPLIHSQL